MSSFLDIVVIILPVAASARICAKSRPTSTPRSNFEEPIVAPAESLMRLGLLIEGMTARRLRR